MSVAMTNCGAAGWVSDDKGYRYAALDPATGERWPPMPQAFSDLATAAADRAGFGRFTPDACLINRYEPGARLSLHQDRNERDMRSPDHRPIFLSGDGHFTDYGNQLLGDAIAARLEADPPWSHAARRP